ncbi:magnesium transporter CorA family protein [Lysinibacillus xylanilyticus]|uniref:magnesium transporter CorA family protein n=1 Tax=Lysinibacillus xylanilyticus TaxID=582475 RepID=UPI002B23F7A1|nr:magnesium transporter CorA family protein [Lysinibacillus xylanilyticus]MEB2299922.1 magnesium transporter CorA family protein [Lysinibacillus xylanilyticus]
MLKIYKRGREGLEEQPKIVQGSCVYLTEPTKEDIQYVANRLGIPTDFISDSLDIDERSRIEKSGNDLLLIVNVPLKMPNGETIPYRTIPIGIIQTSEVIVIICRSNDHPILQEFSKILDKDFNNNINVSFILQLLLVSASYYLHCLDDVDQKVIVSEKIIQKSIKNNDVYTLLNINKSLVYFTKALKVNLVMMKKLSRALKMNEEDEKWVQATFNEMQQAHDTSKIYNENLSNLMDAYSAAIEINLSVVVKVLTAFTIILTFPTMVATIYGMNFPLPKQDEAYALVVLMSFSTVISLLTGWVFYKTKLF